MWYYLVFEGLVAIYKRDVQSTFQAKYRTDEILWIRPRFKRGRYHYNRMRFFRHRHESCHLCAILWAFVVFQRGNCGGII